MKPLWYKKYLPKDFSEYVFRDDNVRDLVLRWMQEKSIPHILLAGPTGTGKTALAELIINTLLSDSNDVLKLDASKDNGTDTVRNVIHSFCENGGWSGESRIVLLDEFDRFSAPAQETLRGIMTEYADTVRFIMTCNYPRRVEAAIRGRCTPLIIDAMDREAMTMRMAEILIAEGGTPDDESIAIIESIIREHYPNMRAAVQRMENGFKDGKLHAVADYIEETPEWDSTIVGFIMGRIGLADLRLSLEALVPEEMETIYVSLYRKSNELFGDLGGDAGKKREGDAIHIIATYLFRHPTCAFPVINICDMLLQLANLRSKA